MDRLKFKKLNFDGLFVVSRKVLGDERGFLSRIWCAEEMIQAGWNGKIAQINHTYNQKLGTVRGMHFQRKPYGEQKLVSCIKGSIWDVVVDLRAESQTFLQWHAEELSEKNNRALMIPEGFAHGYQTLTDDVELLYCHSNSFDEASEGGLNPKDPRISVEWPSEITVISPRDLNHPFLTNDFNGI